MSGDGAFMYYNGRRIEWEMVHPAFKQMFAFGLHGPELCLELGVHPMFPLPDEIKAVASIIGHREEALV